MRLRRLFALLLSLVLSADTFASTPTASEAKQALHALQQKITHFKSTLAQASQKQQSLETEIKHIQQQINVKTKKIQTLHNLNLAKQQEINQFNDQIQHLNQTLKLQQVYLYKHLKTQVKLAQKARYTLLNTLFYPAGLQQFQHLLRLHQYLMHARNRLINHLKHTKKACITAQHNRQTALTQAQALETSLGEHQAKLKQHQDYYMKLLNVQAETVIKTQHKITDFEKNEQYLTHIISQLTKKSVQTNRRFQAMQHHLPWPMDVSTHAIKPGGNGLKFMVNQAQDVRAIFAGKVVFSHWLNGYGLLLIIDHGEGYMSLYAHNHSLVKSAGAMVKMHELIAYTAQSVTTHPSLYFEIRHQGRALNPKDWLALRQQLK
ncbi:MAG: hypothetical protein CMF38_05505 [Legionellaceae bacterium]|nr:hypothetical protein [Legionellaceae bacterium]HCA90030.1 hypothetical protein [Legionellales bacterium]|tara:strand:- start:2940 stop:4067 length:1128 start_codon:yes stop_codon:yes gene_type:complete